MANYVRMGGLALGGFARANGQDFNGEFSKLLDEIYRTSEELTRTLGELQQLLKGQVLAHSDAAKIALDNAMKLSGQKRYDELVYARRMFELCYSELFNIPFLGGYKGEVAFCIAMTNSLLGENALVESWLRTSERDFNNFINEKAPEGASGGDVFLASSGISAAALGGLVTALAILSGGTAAFIIGWGIFTGTAAKAGLSKSEEADLKNKINRLAQQQKHYSCHALQDVKEIIANLPKSDEQQKLDGNI